jgi:hypothetical protein
MWLRDLDLETKIALSAPAPVEAIRHNLRPRVPVTGLTTAGAVGLVPNG